MQIRVSAALAALVGAVAAIQAAGGGAATSPGDPVAGKRVFSQAGCGACHTFGPAGSTGTVGPRLDGLTLPLESVVALISSGRGGMPAFATKLTDQQIADVAAFVTGVPAPPRPAPGTGQTAPGSGAVPAPAGGGAPEGARTVRVTFTARRLVLAPAAVPAGPVRLEVKNRAIVRRLLVVLRSDRAPCALRVRANRVQDARAIVRLGMRGRASRSIRVTLEPGNYLVLDNLPGRYRAGLVARLRVLPAPSPAPAATSPASAVTGTLVPAPPAEEPIPPPTPQALFQAVCGSCHTLAAAGTTGTAGPNLDRERRSADEVAKVIRTGGGPMPSFAGRLTEQQIAEIAALVASASAGSSGDRDD